MQREEVLEIADCFRSEISRKSSLAFVTWIKNWTGGSCRSRCRSKIQPASWREGGLSWFLASKARLFPGSVKSACAGSTACAWGCWRRASRSSTSATSAGTLQVSFGPCAHRKVSACLVTYRFHCTSADWDTMTSVSARLRFHVKI